MSNLIAPLIPLVLPTVLSLLPLPHRLRTPQATRNLLIAVTTLYIIYTFVSTDLAHSSEPNLYSLLGFSRTISPEGITTGYRSWAKRNHPDRLRGVGVQERFVRATAAKNILGDPVRRWAYDRFGEQIVHWKGIATEREFLIRGLTNSIGFYVVSAGVLVFWSLTGQGGSKKTSFWRNISLPALFILELSLYTLPSPTAFNASPVFTSSTSIHPLPIRVLTYLFPQRTQHQLIQLLHNLYLCFSMVLNQLVPLLFPSSRLPPDASIKSLEEREAELAAVSEKLAVLVSIAELEAAKLYKSSLYPILSAPSGWTSEESDDSLPRPLSQLLEDEQVQVMIDHRIRTHPAVAPVWARAIDEARAKEEAERHDSSRASETQLVVEGGEWERSEADVVLIDEEDGSDREEGIMV